MCLQFRECFKLITRILGRGEVVGRRNNFPDFVSYYTIVLRNLISCKYSQTGHYSMGTKRTIQLLNAPYTDEIVNRHPSPADGSVEPRARYHLFIACDYVPHTSKLENDAPRWEKRA